MEGNRWPVVATPQIFSDLPFNRLQVFAGVVVFSLTDIEVNLVVLLGVIVAELVTQRDLIVNLVAQHQSSLIRPASRHILNSVATTSKQYQWNPEPLHHF